MKFKSKIVLSLVIKIGKFFCIWPLEPDTKFIFKSLHEVKRFIFILIELGFIIPFILSAYHNYHDEWQKAIKAIGDSAPHQNHFLNLILWRIQQNQLQKILDEATKYVMKLKDEKKNTLETYLNRYFSLHIFTSISAIGTVICYAFNPLLLPQILVTDTTWYPFEIEVFTVRHFIVYLSQVLATIQLAIAAMLIIAINIILLVTVTTKLHILALKIQKIKNENQLRKCIRKHQKIIRCAKEIDHVMRFMILKSYIFIAMTAIFAAIQIFFPKNFYHFIGSTLYIGTCLVGVYIFAWAADDMREASTNIALAVYNLNWTECSPIMRKSMVVMMCRAQKSLDISVNGILPALTLEFFAKFIMFIISYFMTLRALITQKSKE